MDSDSAKNWNGITGRLEKSRPAEHLNMHLTEGSFEMMH